MNKKKIGLYIKSLRENKKFTQETLAEKVFVGREAVSKWERGKTIPDIEVLLELSRIFDVSINDMLAGEKNTAKNAVVELYKEGKKLKSFLHLTLTLLFILMIIFLVNYFVRSYKSFHVYSISIYNQKYTINDGIIVKSNDKIYFNTGKISFREEDIIELKLYYVINGEQFFICSTNNNYIIINDYKGYEEYFDFKNFKNIISNMYLLVTTTSGEEKIQLSINETYTNRSLLFLGKKKDSHLENISANIIDNAELINYILNNFKRIDDNYIKKVMYKDGNYSFMYNDKMNLLVLTVDNNDLRKEYYYDVKYGYITYNHYLSNQLIYSFSYTDSYVCNYGDCYYPEDIIKDVYEMVKYV